MFKKKVKIRTVRYKERKLTISFPVTTSIKNFFKFQDASFIEKANPGNSLMNIWCFKFGYITETLFFFNPDLSMTKH